MADPNPNDIKRRWFEPASAILMALATLSTAWCSYNPRGGMGRAAASLQKRVALTRKLRYCIWRETR